jgi:hypothetical protein
VRGNLVLDLAADVGALIIVSDDSDLTSISPWRGTPVLRPTEFASRVDAMRRARRRHSWPTPKRTWFRPAPIHRRPSQSLVRPVASSQAAAPVAAGQQHRLVGRTDPATVSDTEVIKALNTMKTPT